MDGYTHSDHTIDKYAHHDSFSYLDCYAYHSHADSYIYANRYCHADADFNVHCERYDHYNSYCYVDGYAHSDRPID
jgi:hypothetical protein